MLFNEVTMSRRPRRSDSSPRSLRLTLVSAITVAGGLVYLMVGMAQLLQPEWYFENLVPIAPYNRPGIGLSGSLLLPLGAVMIIASQNPSSSRLVIGLGAAASVLMLFSFWYGAATGEFVTAENGLLVMGLIVLALGLMWAFWQVRPRFRRK